MHRLIEDHLEELLSAQGRFSPGYARKELLAVQQHLDQCEECRILVAAMREQNLLLQSEFSLEQAPAMAELDPVPGFYARVMERIEAQRPVSVWDMFLDSLWGRRLATSSLAMALLMGGYVVTAEAVGGEPARFEASMEAGPVLPGSDFAEEVFASKAGSQLTSVPSGDAVFVSLVTYRRQ